MRAIEFLVEYNRSKTAEVMGGIKALQALINDGSIDLSPQLKSLQSQLKKMPNLSSLTPEQIKSALETILPAIEEKDPTPTKAYTPWMARMYGKGGLKIEDMNRMGWLELFDLAKKRRLIKPEHADVNRFKTYADFEKTMMDTYDPDEISAPQEEPIKGNAQEVFNGKTVRIIVPKDKEAACYYGQGTTWCTAATRGTNYFDTYSKDGPLYILIPKKQEYDREKYQLHFETNQYMDEQDSPVSLSYLMSRFPDANKFFQSLKQFNNSVMFASDEEIASIVEKVRKKLEPTLSKLNPEDAQYIEEIFDEADTELRFWAAEPYIWGSDGICKLNDIPKLIASYIVLNTGFNNNLAQVTDVLNKM